MKVNRAVLMWLIIIVIGSLIHIFISFNLENFENITGSLFLTTAVGLAFSLPSLLIFLVVSNSILAKTNWAKYKREGLIIGLHILLTFLTFSAVYGSLLFSRELYLFIQFLSYATVGVLVWGIYIFTLTKKAKK